MSRKSPRASRRDIRGVAKSPTRRNEVKLGRRQRAFTRDEPTDERERETRDEPRAERECEPRDITVRLFQFVNRRVVIYTSKFFAESRHFVSFSAKTRHNFCSKIIIETCLKSGAIET